MEKAKGPQFLRFCIPIVETLQALGGSGQPKEVLPRLFSIPSCKSWMPAGMRKPVMPLSAWTRGWNLLFVVYIELEEDAIRLISARQATRKEREDYEA